MGRNRLAPDGLDLFGGGTGPGGLDRIVQSFDHDLFGFGQLLGRFAQMHGTRHGAVVAFAHTRRFDDRRFACFERRIRPGEMRRGSPFPGRQHRRKGRILAAKLRRA